MYKTCLVALSICDADFISQYAVLTPAWHEDGVEDGAWVVEQIADGCVQTDVRQVPVPAPYNTQSYQYRHLATHNRTSTSTLQHAIVPVPAPCNMQSYKYHQHLATCNRTSTETLQHTIVQVPRPFSTQSYKYRDASTHNRTRTGTLQHAIVQGYDTTQHTIVPATHTGDTTYGSSDTRKAQTKIAPFIKSSLD